MATSISSHVESIPRHHSVTRLIQARRLTRLSRSEVRRRLVHMTPGVLPFVLHYLHGERPLPWSVLIEVTVMAILLTAAGAYYFRTYARHGEVFEVGKVLSYSAVALPMLFLFRWHPELGSVVLTVLSFGDGSATLFGILFGRKPLPWNPSKSWAGFCAFFFCAIVPTVWAYWEVATPDVPFLLALKCSVVAILVAQVVESVTPAGDDNFRVGLAAAFGVLLAQTIFVGWPTMSPLTG